jgi:hypothetical protein
MIKEIAKIVINPKCVSTIQTIISKDIKYKVTVLRITDDDCCCGCGEKAKGRSKYSSTKCRQVISRRKKKLLKK